MTLRDLVSELARIPQPDAVHHRDSISNVLKDLEVGRDELLGLLPLRAGAFDITVELARDRIVFRRVEPREFVPR